MWTSVLPTAQIQAEYIMVGATAMVLCHCAYHVCHLYQGRPERDWKGLYGAFHLDGNLADAGSAKWLASVEGALPFNFWRRDGAEVLALQCFTASVMLIFIH